MPYRGKSYSDCKVSYNKRMMMDKKSESSRENVSINERVEKEFSTPLKTRKISETAKNGGNKQEYCVNDRNGIWLCPMVLKGKQECQYGLCIDCYIKKAPKKRRRVRDKCMNTDNNVCRHDLVMNFTNFFDGSYFTKQYKKNNTFVGVCGNCKVTFIAKN